MSRLLLLESNDRSQRAISNASAYLMTSLAGFGKDLGLERSIAESTNEMILDVYSGEIMLTTRTFESAV